MRKKICFVAAVVFAGILSWVANRSTAADKAPSKARTVELAMSLRPVQIDVEYDIPDKKTWNAFKVNVVREGKASGWVVLGPNGQTLRRFMDTNDDNLVDQFSYYQNGMEVYRDIDSNFNNKVDQSRWLNMGGSRWGIDKNEDGRIDTWKVISPEEVSRIAVRALVTQDVNLIVPLLITKDDLKDLGIKGPIAAKLLEAVDVPTAKLKANGASKLISARTTWLHFDGLTPSLIPADQMKTTADLLVYENTMAIVDTDNKPGLVHIGELIRVGEAWKMTALPLPADPMGGVAVAGGILMQPELGAAGGGDAPPANADVNPKMQKLITELQDLIAKRPGPNESKTKIAQFHAELADHMERLIADSATDEERTQWTRQMADDITAAVQVGAYPNGVTRLKALRDKVTGTKKNAKSPLAAYVTYRYKLAVYHEDMQTAENNKRQKIQDDFLKDMEQFIEDYPDSEDAGDASLQLAIANEFNGKIEVAKKWYKRIIDKHPKAGAFKRANGAMHRLDLVGRQLALSGPDYNGKGIVNISSPRFQRKIVLVIFWATWCKPCTEDLPPLIKLYNKFNGQDKPGFEVLGVNLDTDKSLITPYLKQQKVPWDDHIFLEGGLESPLAVDFGVISLPTMFLVDATGKVVKANASVQDVESLLAPEVKK